jgi:UDP-glucuronate decarboxylase
MNKIIKEDIKKIVVNLNEFDKKIKDKTFLVTGGAGFLGSWFCDVLHEFGANVICIDNLVTGSKKNIQHLIGEKNFKFIEQDVCNPFELKENIDYIVHMACIASPPYYQKFPIETLNANIIGTINMLELARKKKVKAFLFSSTSEVYGNPPEGNIPTPEDYPGHTFSYGPRSMYDEGKRAAEAYLYANFLQFKSPSIRIARIFNTFGPRLDTKLPSTYGRALIKFIHQALTDQPITVYGDGSQTRSFCYVTDQIEGLFKLLLADGIDFEIVNIGNDKETTILDLAKKIKSITNSKSKINCHSIPEFDIINDPSRRCPDISKARSLLKFSPKITLEEGLKNTVEWLKSE